jgi:hypothetical protein
MSLFSLLPDDSELPQAPVCSRKGCRAPAQWRLQWNNPKIHTPERRKTWLACAEHRDWLEDYLRTRLLWRETLPLTEAPSSCTDS